VTRMQGARPGWGRGGRYAGWVVLGSAGLLVLSGCAALDTTPDADWGGVCEDDITHVRIDDSYCGDWDSDGIFYSPGGYNGYSHPTRMVWYSRDYGGDVPGIGQRVTSAATKVPSGAPVAKGIPKTGATAKSGGMGAITRGGFGVRAGTSGGTGAKAAAGGSGGS